MRKKQLSLVIMITLILSLFFVGCENKKNKSPKNGIKLMGKNYMNKYIVKSPEMSDGNTSLISVFTNKKLKTLDIDDSDKLSECLPFPNEIENIELRDNNDKLLAYENTIAIDNEDAQKLGLKVIDKIQLKINGKVVSHDFGQIDFSNTNVNSPKMNMYLEKINKDTPIKYSDTSTSDVIEKQYKVKKNGVEIIDSGFTIGNEDVMATQLNDINKKYVKDSIIVSKFKYEFKNFEFGNITGNNYFIIKDGNNKIKVYDDLFFTIIVI